MAEIFSRAALRRIEADTFVRHVEFHRELPSTNDLALELAGRDELDTPLLVLAEHQTAGRGRGANQWWSLPGALTFSLIVEAPGLGAAQQTPPISLSAGLAVCQALEAHLPGVPFGLKWPNDVWALERKVSGILVEIPPKQSRRVVIGVGINVNNSLAAAPEELQAIATSLYDTRGEALELPGILIGVLTQLAIRLQMLTSGDPNLAAEWQSYCVLSGKKIELDLGSRRVRGLCHGIDPYGALQLETDRGLESFLSGIVVK